MNRLGHIIWELGRNLVRYPWTALGSLLSLTLLFLLFDLYWIGVGTFDRAFERLVSDVQMEVFVGEEVEEVQIPELRNALSSVEGVTTLEYISKEQARQIMFGSIGVDLLAGYDTINPLPRSMLLDFNPQYLNSAHLVEVAEQIRSMPAVSDLYYNDEWLRKTEGTRSIILRIGMALGILILVTAVISSVNNIRLMTGLKSAGLAQMRLLGASRIFLFAPMLLEGFLIGSLAAAAGWAFLFYLVGQVTFTQFDLIYPQTTEILGFCTATGLLGVVSGYLGVRKLLK